MAIVSLELEKWGLVTPLPRLLSLLQFSVLKQKMSQAMELV